MRGYLIWLVVALACSSMAQDLGLMTSQLRAINEAIDIEKHRLQRMNEFKIQRLNGIKEELDSKISTLQKDLLIEKLELAKFYVKLDRKDLLLGHCLYSEKAQEDVKRIAKEQADEKAAELESEAKKELQAKYTRLLQEQSLDVSRLPK
ncbi:hypothetical protein KR038_002438 [Drosophila bunnanda]|nr:hypothetical protein KR038_002438 [Drosophila bunnanda]